MIEGVYLCFKCERGCKIECKVLNISDGCAPFCEGMCCSCNYYESRDILA